MDSISQVKESQKEFKNTTSAEDVTPKNKTRYLFGRRQLLATPPSKYTANTVGKILEDVLPAFEQNAEEANYLYRYMLGDQPELTREKITNNEIRTPVVVNFAQEGVNFKVGYEHSQPKTYTNSSKDETLGAPIEQINVWARMDEKEEKDAAMYSWVYTAGHGYRLTLPTSPKEYVYGDTAPYFTVTLDPRNTFVVYSAGIDRKPIICGTRYSKTTVDGNNKSVRSIIYSVYAPNKYFEYEMTMASDKAIRLFAAPFDISSAKVIKSKSRPSALLPIEEFILRDTRKGIVESIMTLQDAYNELSSDRIEAITAHVESLLVLEGAELPKDDAGNKQIPKTGNVVELPAGQGGNTPNLKFITNPLDQNHVHITRNDYREDIYETINIPGQGGNSGGDTGKAVDLRNGWFDAETDAKITQKYYNKSDKSALRFILEIAREVEPESIGKLTLSDIDIKHTRERGDDLWPRVQSFDLMVKNNVPYDLAAKEAGMFVDAEMAAGKIMAEEERKSKLAKEAEVNENSAQLQQATNPDETILVAEEGNEAE